MEYGSVEIAVSDIPENAPPRRKGFEQKLLGSFLFKRCPWGKEKQLSNSNEACKTTKPPFDGVDVKTHACVFDDDGRKFRGEKTLPGELRAAEMHLDFKLKGAKHRLPKDWNWTIWMEKKRVKRETYQLKMSKHYVYVVFLNHREIGPDRILADYINGVGPNYQNIPIKDIIGEWQSCSTSKYVAPYTFFEKLMQLKLRARE